MKSLLRKCLFCRKNRDRGLASKFYEKMNLCSVNMSFSWQKIWWSDAKIEKSLGAR